MASSTSSNSVTILALSGLILALAAWNVAGWFLTFRAIAWAAGVICTVAACSEILAANQAIEAEKNWSYAKPKAYGNFFALAVFGMINTAGSHNTWHQLERLILAPSLIAQTEAYEANLDELKRQLNAAADRVQSYERRIDEIPIPDPRDLTSRQQAAAAFYQTMYAPLSERLTEARNEQRDIEAAIVTLPIPPTPTLLPSWAVWLGFGALEIVKAVGFWALSSRRLSLGLPLTASQAGARLVRCRADRRAKPT